MASAGQVVRRSCGGVMVGLAMFGMAACSARPSEGEVRDKLVELFEATPSLEGNAEPLADCMAPEVSTQLSDDGLDALMDAEASDALSGGGGEISAKDQEAFTDIATGCASEVLGGTSGGSAPTS